MSGSRVVVLVVEDNPALSEMIRRHLARKGFQVKEASTGEIALIMIQEVHPDIILLDMNLPGKCGWAIAEELRSDESTRPIPIIAITAHAMQGDRERAIEAGCDEYVSKPINFTELVRRIHGLLDAPDK